MGSISHREIYTNPRELGKEFGAKCVFITFSFDIWPGKVVFVCLFFLMEQGSRDLSHRVDLYHWGKKCWEKTEELQSLIAQRTSCKWPKRKQNTADDDTTMHYISAFFNDFFFFKLVFSVCCFGAFFIVMQLEFSSCDVYECVHAGLIFIFY